MGVDNAKNRPATQEEMAQMKQLMRDAMSCGAAGFGAQILGATSVQRDYDGTPMITDTMAKEDLYAFGSVLNEFGRGFMQVAGPSRKTTENLAKASGRPILYNAITPDVDQHGQKTENAALLMKWFDECNREKGLRIYGQAITTMNLKSPQCFSLDIFNLFDASPPWRRITLGDPAERMKKMRDPKHRQACKDQFDNPNKTINLNSIDRTNKEGLGAEQDGGLGLSLRKLVLETSNNPEHSKFLGLTLGEIAEQRNAHVVDTFPGRLPRGRPEGELAAAGEPEQRGEPEGDRNPSLHHPRCERRWCAHEVHHRRGLLDGFPREPGPRQRRHEPRGRALASGEVLGDRRGDARSRLHRRRDAGGRDRLRHEEPSRHGRGDRLRLPRGRVAPGPPG